MTRQFTLRLTGHRPSIRLILLAIVASLPALSSHATVREPVRAPFELTIPSLHASSATVFNAPLEGRRSVRPWKPSSAWWLAGLGLALTDETTQKWLDPDLNHIHRSTGFARSVSRIGDPAIMALPALALYLSGSHGRRATRDAATAVVDASIVTFALKELTGKERPTQSGGKVRFHGPGSHHYESFPSGHSTAAWAAATVLAEHYPRQRTLFYLAATAVAWARVREGKHFLSDVAAGAAIGVASGRRVIRHGHGFLDFRF